MQLADVSPASPCACGLVGDPLGVRIPSDSLMEWINEHSLKEFVRGIFTNPVRIRDSQSPTVASYLSVGNRLKALSKLQLVSTMTHRLAIGYTLRNRVFEAAIVHMNLIDDITLLGLLSQAVLYEAGWGGGAL